MRQPRLDREAVLKHIADNPGVTSKRDIARALGVKGGQRDQLKTILKELQHEGLIERGRGRRLRPEGVLPRVVVATVGAVDDAGELTLHPASAADAIDADLHLPPENVRGRAPGLGDRVLVRTEQRPDGSYDAQLIRILPTDGGRLTGMVKQAADGLYLRPANRRERSMRLDPHLMGDAVPGDLVEAEAITPERMGLRRGRVVRRIGAGDDPRQFSHLAAAAAGLPEAFAPAAQAQAEAQTLPGTDGRIDLTEEPLVTIDG